MQVSSATPFAPSPSPASGVVAEVMRQAAILADDSGASDDQKVDAYVAITTAIVTSASGRAGWFEQSTQADRDVLNATWNNSAVSKQIRQAADDFNARGMSAPREGNVMASQIVALNRMPALQQKMIFAGTASLDQTPTLDGWKAFLQDNADIRDQQLAAEKTEKDQAVKVTLSDNAKAALGDDAKKALATLTTERPGGDIAEAALGMLRRAAERRAADEDKGRGQERNDKLGVTVDRTA